MQLNINLDEADILRVKKAALTHGVSLGEFATQAFQQFLSKPISAREIYFGKRKPVMGRKIKI